MTYRQYSIQKISATREVGINSNAKRVRKTDQDAVWIAVKVAVFHLAFEDSDIIKVAA